MKRSEEIWVSVGGYEGLLEVSNLGRIKSLERRFIDRYGNQRIIEEHIVYGTLNKYGYYTITRVNEKGVQKTLKIHRLAAIAFIPNPESLPQINHKNGIKTDNHVENLEWVSHRENIQHAYDNNLMKSFFSGDFNKKTKGKSVKCETLDIVFNSVREAANALGISSDMINKVCIGKYIQSNGLTFRYV